jgi:ketosteroid isomerase-like protein
MTMLRADECIPRDADEALVLSYFTTLMQRDLDAFEALWQEDAEQVIPFLPEGFGRFVPDTMSGRDALMAHYRVAFENRREHVFWIDAIHAMREPGSIVVEAHARSLVGETGRVYENRYVCFFEIRNGRLARLKEYVNPLAFMKAFGGGFDAHR